MPDIFDASKNKKTPREVSVSARSKAKAEGEDTAVKAEEQAPSMSETKKHSRRSESAVADHETETEKPNPRAGRSVDDYSEVMRQEKSTNNPLKSFVAKPSKIFFASQHSEEQVLLLLRRHPVTQVGWVVTSLVLAVVPFFFSSIGMLNFLPGAYQFAVLVGWYLLIMGFALESFLSWFYNVYIITDERIIDVDFYNLLYHNISAAKIDNIEDITTVAGGVLASIFSYGTVTIQTAGSVTEFEFEDVPQPAKVTAFINEMLLEEEREELEKRVN